MRRVWPYILAALAVAALAGLSRASASMNPYLVQILVYIGINVILASSLNLINGFTGQFSLGHAGLMAIGAYVSAAMSYYLGGLPGTPAAGHGAVGYLQAAGIPAPVASAGFFLAALLAGGATATVAGILVGLPTLRLRGDYLAIATLGFGEIVRIVISQIDKVGGPRGFSGIPRMTSIFWVGAWVAVTLIVLRNLLTSTHGRAFASIREDEVAAEAMGVDTTRYKVAAFAIGAFFAGIAGGLFGHYLMYLHPFSFSFLKSIEIVVMVVLGGMGSLVGSAAAAGMLTLLPEILRTFTGVLAVAYCFALALLVLRARATGRLARGLRRAGLAAAGLLTVVALATAQAEGAQTGAPAAVVVLAIIAAALTAAAFAFEPGIRRVSGMAAIAMALAVFCAFAALPYLLPGRILTTVSWVEAHVSQLRLVIYAALLVGLMLTRPTGLLGNQELTWRAIRSVFRPARRPATA